MKHLFLFALVVMWAPVLREPNGMTAMAPQLYATKSEALAHKTLGGWKVVAVAKIEVEE